MVVAFGANPISLKKKRNGANLVRILFYLILKKIEISHFFCFYFSFSTKSMKNGEKSEDGKRKREVVSKIISNMVIFGHFTMKNWFSNLF